MKVYAFEIAEGTTPFLDTDLKRGMGCLLDNIADAEVGEVARILAARRLRRLSARAVIRTFPKAAEPLIEDQRAKPGFSAGPRIRL